MQVHPFAGPPLRNLRPITLPFPSSPTTQNRQSMLSWLIRTARSSIGRKAFVALTGLALVGFLVVHLAGNLTFFADSEGVAFDHYAETLESNPLLPLAELGLLVLFLVHIVMAVRLTFDNKKARPTPYMVKKSHGARTPGSRTMIMTGIVILLFLVLHLAHFRLQQGEGVSFAALVKFELSKPLAAGAYVVGILALGLHLSHAIPSALQSLGLSHPKYTPMVRVGGLGLAIILTVGFLMFPILVFFGGNS
ncbi:MAG: succinate dehydrogenase / fumarate reductase cytochrome b subunit [Planctomycetota bacterium]|jgi:succinate dehydrogenase / fumarate reductase cytochrome b subunit